MPGDEERRPGGANAPGGQTSDTHLDAAPGRGARHLDAAPGRGARRVPEPTAQRLRGSQGPAPTGDERVSPMKSDPSWDRSGAGDAPATLDGQLPRSGGDTDTAD